MKFFVTFFLVLIGSYLFAEDIDPAEYDTNFRLYDVQRTKTVDTSVRIRLVEPEDIPRDKSNDFITGPVSGGPHPIGGNYDSIHNINPKVAGFISVCFLSFVAFIVFRVRRSLKRDEKRNKRD